MKIGEIAGAAECDVATVRYYERAGLMPSPGRTTANYRTYGPGHIERLRFIRRCRSLDMALDEVRVLLSFLDAPDMNCASVNEALDRHIGHIEARLDELTQLRDELRRLRKECRRARTAKTCGILDGLKGAPSSAHSSNRLKGPRR